MNIVLMDKNGKYEPQRGRPTSPRIFTDGLAQRFAELEAEWKVTRDRSVSPQPIKEATDSDVLVVATVKETLTGKSSRSRSISPQQHQRTNRSTSGQRRLVPTTSRVSPRNNSSGAVTNNSSVTKDTLQREIISNTASFSVVPTGTAPDAQTNFFCSKCGYDLRGGKSAPKFCRECGFKQ